MALITFVVIGMALFFVAVIGLIVYFIFYLREMDIPLNANIVWNWNPELTEGHVILSEISCSRISRGYRCKVLPIDVYVDPNSSTLEKKEYDFIIPKSFRKVAVKGNPSVGRNIVSYEPYDATLIADEFKEGAFGKSIVANSEIAKFVEASTKANNTVKENVYNWMIEHTNMPEEVILKQIDSLLKQRDKMSEKESKKEGMQPAQFAVKPY